VDVSKITFRAWLAVALAIRYAQIRGLHLTRAIEGDTGADQNLGQKLWETIVAVELKLCLLTGRFPALGLSQLSRPTQETIVPDWHPARPPTETDAAPNPSSRSLPLPAENENIFGASTDLDRILAETLDSIYLIPSSQLKSRRSVRGLNTKLDSWQAGLPRSIRQARSSADGSRPSTIETAYLKVRYHNIRLVLNWPSFCEYLDSSNDTRIGTVVDSGLDSESMKLCIGAARAVLRLLPRDFTAAALLHSTPWWSILHALVRAGSVIVMAIVHCTTHMSNKDVDTLVGESVFVLRWLQELSKGSASAERVWHFFSQLTQMTLAIAHRDPNLIVLYIPPDIALATSSYIRDILYNISRDCDSFSTT
jgi:hypothetical protein